MGAVATRSAQRCFGGVQGFYAHASAACAGEMRFAVYLPPRALAGERVPAVYYLAGLTCTEETFAVKAGAQRVAAALGLALVAPDTSPRALRLPGDDASWDLGLGAGFYLDATQEPWSRAYRMESYVRDELVPLIEENFPVVAGRRGATGHSMGGHGALTLALRNPGLFASVTALAPIAAPSEVPWGEKAFRAYLGDDRAAWRAHDAAALIEDGRRIPGTVLVDQGDDDKFLTRELRPERLAHACAMKGQALSLRRHPGYDHSYYFIQSFIEDHLAHHARALAG